MTLVSDPLLPAVEHLLGPGAGHLLRTVVDAGGGAMDGYERRQVLYRPGDRAAVRFAVRVRWGNDPATEETVVAVTTTDGPPPGTLVLRTGDLAVGLFRYPHDPELPGLPVATFADRLEGWLGLGTDPALRVRSYRPTRRAVVHARWGAAGDPGATERYVKCVPTGEVAGIAHWLARLRRHVPVPAVLELHADLGLLALEPLPGRTIREVVLGDDLAAYEALPGAAAILGLLDAMPRPEPAMDAARPGPIERAVSHGALLAAVLPSVAAQVSTLVTELGPDQPDAPEVLVHGDLYDAQVLVDADGITGLLDVDGAGRGRRVDDLATFLAHLEALADAVPRRRDAIDRYLARLRPGFEAAVGRAVLSRTTAAALIGLATGPFRVQQADWPGRVEDRLALAERWSAMARHDTAVTARRTAPRPRLGPSDERDLSGPSPVAQARMRN